MASRGVLADVTNSAAAAGCAQAGACKPGESGGGDASASSAARYPESLLDHRAAFPPFTMRDFMMSKRLLGQGRFGGCGPLMRGAPRVRAC